MIQQIQKCLPEEYEQFLQKKLGAASSGWLSFLQSSMWGQFKQRQGWTAHYFRGQTSAKHGGCEMDFCTLVLTRPLLPRCLSALPALLSIAYIPFGPVFLRETESSDLQEVWNRGLSEDQYFAACRGIVQGLLGLIPLSCFFVRLDSNALEFGKTAGTEQRRMPVKNVARRFGFRAAAQRVQVPDTILLDLSKEDLLAQMHKKHRYNIRLAGKKGVQICELGWQQGLADWYQLYQTTAQRDRIGIHKLSYYQSLFEQQESAKEGLKDGIEVLGTLHLYCAYAPQNPENESDPRGPLLAGIIVLHYHSTATYLYGASSNEQRELMPNYLLQWHAICKAREAGLSCYDFFGIPPQPESKHPMYGLYRFKTGFGGYAIRRLGAWDMPYSLFFYGLYRLLEYGRLLLYRLRHR